jgi:hypothetical protein
MTYQGARARPADDETKRFFSVSKVRLDSAGWATHVLWSEVNPKTNGDVGDPFIVPVGDVVDAIHDGAHVVAIYLQPNANLPDIGFEVIERWDGSETIDLVKRSGADSVRSVDLKMLAILDEEPTVPQVRAATAPIRRTRTFAVSQVALDGDGRVTDVLWGLVDTAKNAWAQPEVIAPVAAVVDALQAGDQVFALFPSIHGHLPDLEFTQANYDGSLRTIVLMGPTAYEREIHDMDRISN